MLFQILFLTIFTFGNFHGIEFDSLKLNELNSYSKVLINASGNMLDSFYSKRTTTVFMTVAAESERNQYQHFKIAKEIMLTQDCNLSFAVETSSLDNKLFRRFFSFFIVESYQSFRFDIRNEHISFKKRIQVYFLLFCFAF